MPLFSVKVDNSLVSPIRLDKYIASLSDTVNRSRLKNGVIEILVNNKKAKLSTKVHAGDQIDIEWEDLIPTDISPENIPLDILYEDQNVTVINKKQGMVTHPASGNWTGTLVNALLYHWGKQALSQETSGISSSQMLAQRRPGIVHRLDKDTSGVIITARNPETEEYLQKQFHDRLCRKEYIAIVKGRPPVQCAEIKTQIIRDSKNRKRFIASTDTTAGKFAHTVYYCISSWGPYSLMRIRLKTGRTHQIRVHLKYIGCPILGDPIYGTSKQDKLFKNVTLMLHARTLLIKLPNKTKLKKFRASVPIRFKKVLKTLHKTYEKSVFPMNAESDRIWNAARRIRSQS